MTKKLSTFDKEMQNPAFKAEFDKQYNELVISELIIELMEKEEKSVRQLASDTGLSTNSINKIRTGRQKDVKLSNFISIANACGYVLSLEKGKEKIKLNQIQRNEHLR